MIYIASRYRARELNRTLEKSLREQGFEVFLPEHVGIDAYSPAEKRDVACACEEAIRKSSVMLLIAPYRNDVSFEIGYAVACAEFANVPKPIVLYDQRGSSALSNDDMISPHVDSVASSLDELVDRLRRIEEAAGKAY